MIHNSGFGAFGQNDFVRLPRRTYDMNCLMTTRTPYPNGAAGRRPRSAAARGLVAVALVCAAGHGCGPSRQDSESDAYQTLLESERQMRESLQKQHGLVAENWVAIRLVQSSAAPDGGGAVSNWVERVVAEYDTSLFPRWIARKAAVGRYDVRFTCVVTDASGAARPIGYSWSADLALQVVRGPRALSEEELRVEWKGRYRFPSRPGDTQP
jgi:hypothetical protein